MSKVVPGGATTAHGAGRVTQSATQATTVFSIAAWEQSTSLPESHLKYVSELAALTVDQLGSRVVRLVGVGGADTICEAIMAN